MSLLEFNSSNKKTASKGKQTRLIVGIAALAATVAIGSTLAASINLNSGTPVEFGQGVAQTTACDNDIVLTPYSAFVNSVGEGSFSLSAISLSGIDSSVGKCANKDFIIKAYDETSGSPLMLFDSVNSITVTDTGSEFTIPTTSGLSISTIDDSSFKLFISSSHTPIGAENVYRFTIESQEHVAEASYTRYELGETGPGGGRVFYYSSGGFNEVGAPCSPVCHYLEWAPNTWNGGVADPQMLGNPDNTNSSGATGTALGTGLSNTNAQLTDSTPYLADNAGPAFTARPYLGSALTDWFLPSKDELSLMYNSAELGNGGFRSDFYFSSTEASDTNVWYVSFISGNPLSDNKGGYASVRPIRAF